MDILTFSKHGKKTLDPNKTSSQNENLKLDSQLSKIVDGKLHDKLEGILQTQKSPRVKTPKSKLKMQKERRTIADDFYDD